MASAAISGIGSGAAYALLAVCLIVAYRTTGVLNLPAAAVGTWGTFLATVLHDHGWPWIVCAAVGVIAAALIAAAAGVVIARWFLVATVARRTSVSVAMLLLLFALSNRAFGDNARNIPALFNGGFTVAGVVVQWETVAILVVLILIAAILSLVMARTRTGLVLRALTDRPRTTELLGIPIGGYVIGVWLLTGALAAVAMLLVAPEFSSDFGVLAFLVVPAIAAALCGSLRNVWLAALAGVAIGVIEGVVSQIGSISNWQPAIPLIVIMAVLLYTQRGQLWDEAR
jgi:branched-chain amino acid transport system permease protein